MAEPDRADKQRPSRKRTRLVVLLLLGGLVIGAAYFYIHFWLSHPVGQGPAGPAVSKDAFQEVWSERPVLLLGIGDSITAGYGASPHHSYFKLLAANAPDEFPEMQGNCLSAVFPNLATRNLALSGSTSIEHIDILLPRLEVQDADTFGVVVVTTGGNDIIHNYGQSPPREGAMYGVSFEQAGPWIQNFRDRLNTIVDGLEQAFPGGCRIFLANIYDPTDGIGDAFNAGLPSWPDAMKVLDAYNQIIVQCAEQRDTVHMVDIRGPFLGHGIHCRQFWRAGYRSHDPHYWYADNLEDPNDRGYDAIRRLFLIEMAERLPKALSAQTKGNGL